MSTLRSIVLCLILVLFSETATAVSGAATIYAGCIGAPGNYLLCGYNDGALGGPPLGSGSNTTLSDGRRISDFANFLVGGLTIRIGGFVSDPGQGYFTSLSVSCLLPPTTMTSASASYAYTPSTGYAVWSWARVNLCMSLPIPYVLDVN